MSRYTYLKISFGAYFSLENKLVREGATAPRGGAIELVAPPPWLRQWNPAHLILLNGGGIVDTTVVLADLQIVQLVDTVLDHVPEHTR